MDEKTPKPLGKMLHIKIPEDLHKLLRVKVAHENTNIQAFIIKLLESSCFPPTITFVNGESVKLWDLQDTGSPTWSTQIEFFASDGSFLGGTHFHETYKSNADADWYKRQMNKLQAHDSDNAKAVEECLQYIIDARLGKIDPTKIPPPLPKNAILINWP